VQPLAGQAAGAGRASAGAPLPGATNLSAGARSARLVMAREGVIVTATWGTAPSLIRRALSLPSLRPAASGPAPPATDGQAAPRAHGASLPPVAHASVFTGLGLDACSAPSFAAMSAWLSSPYRAVGIYIGGANMACAQLNLTPAWVSAQAAAGYQLIPTYVGLQSPTASCGCASINRTQAAAQGAAAAADAVAHALALGIAPGNPIYDDMEGYTRTATSTAAVLAFLSGWTTTLHADGYLSGVYSSANSGVRDLVSSMANGYPEPDDVWIAEWNGQQTTASAYVPSTDWPAHQRLHQYQGDHAATYGGVTLDIDSDYLDGATAGVTHVVIPDGTFVEVDGVPAVYEIAGDAPLLVSSWQAVGGPQAVTTITQAQFDGLNQVPADGTFLQTSTGFVYRIAGGAPLLVSDWSVYGGPQPTVLIDEWDIDNIGNPVVHLNPVPGNGTFLQTTSGQIYRVAGGAPIAADAWSVFGGPQPAVQIDPWDIANITSPLAHLAAVPADGTLVRGLPSNTYWSFSGGERTPMLANPAAIAVEDVGLAPFTALPAPPGLFGPAPEPCVVPNLHHLTLPYVRTALRQAHCRLGTVRRPRRWPRRHVLRVLGQSVGPRLTRPPGFAVNVLLR
jgi:hypothetical protein